ncbi:MAG: hypothetical protein AAB426_03185 [Myxococcota bacterium]
MLRAWFSCLVVIVTAVPRLASPSGDLQPAWQAQLHAGTGRRNDETVALVQPALSFEAETLSVRLRAPVWLRLAPSSAAAARAQPLHSLHAVGTYVGFVEALRATAFERHVRLEVGQLGAQTLGHGVLVDRLGDPFDPTWRRAAARLAVSQSHARGIVLIDDVARPEVAAVRLEGTPLGALDIDTEGRFRLGVESAWELAPRRLGARARPGGASADVGLLLYRSSFAGVLVYGAVAALHPWATGVHAGLAVETQLPSGRAPALMRFTIEGVGAGAVYDPGYFDVAYAVERWRLPDSSGSPKHTQILPPRHGARVSWSVVGESVSLDATATRLTPSAGGTASIDVLLRGGWQSEQLSLAVLLLQRDAAALSQLVEPRRGTHLQVDASGRLGGPWFAFASGSWGTVARPTHGTAELATWVGGIAYGATSRQVTNAPRAAP